MFSNVMLVAATPFGLIAAGLALHLQAWLSRAAGRTSDDATKLAMMSCVSGYHAGAFTRRKTAAGHLTKVRPTEQMPR